MMSRFNRPARMLCCFGIFASLFGCAPESIGDGEAIGSSSDAIINGTAMTAADEETWGMVRINGGSCSGALFRNQWVLTASHCFDGGLDNPGNYQVSMNTQTVRADAIIPHSTYDVALVHLATPLSRNGSSTSWARALYGSDPTGQTLRCFGFGWTTFTGGGGSLQQALLPVSSVTTERYSLTPNTAGNITWKGDSGGVCLATMGSIAGVQSGANFTTNAAGAVTAVTSSWQFRASAFAAWALRTTGEYGVPNDSRASAIDIPMVRNPQLAWVSPSETNEELVVGGTTQGATPDGPGSGCGCYNGAPNVWYRFTLTQREIVYLDTSGSAFDTSLLVTDAVGNPVPGSAGQPAGLCNDDAGCAAGTGFSGTLESRTFGILDAGTYYVGVGGCGSGRFTLHLQHVAESSAAAVDETRMAGDLLRWWSSTNGASLNTATCTLAPGPERMHWFVTCGGQPQLFSTCRSDQGQYVRASGATLYDTVLYARSAATGKTTACNDDGLSNGATDCTGSGGDSSNYGSRLTYTAPRGLNLVFVDNYNSNQGLQYTLRQTVR